MLSPGKVTPAWLKFLKQFVGFFPLLLEVGGVLCLIGYGLDQSTRDNVSLPSWANANCMLWLFLILLLMYFVQLYLGIILLLVVLLTAIFSFMQESKSASVMEGT
jgi:sodium/potassium-transporting ATPase subunit alpha